MVQRRTLRWTTVANIAALPLEGGTLTARRRSRRRPLTDYASRSPLHAFAVWLLKTAIIVGAAIAVYVVVTQILIPGYANQLVHQVQNTAR